MMEIENALHTLHAKTRVGHERDDADMNADKQVASKLSPFAVVDTVIQGSPAFQAVGFQSTFKHLYSQIL